MFVCMNCWCFPVKCTYFPIIQRWSPLPALWLLSGNRVSLLRGGEVTAHVLPIWFVTDATIRVHTHAWRLGNAHYMWLYPHVHMWVDLLVTEAHFVVGNACGVTTWEFRWWHVGRPFCPKRATVSVFCPSFFHSWIWGQRIQTPPASFHGNALYPVNTSLVRLFPFSHRETAGDLKPSGAGGGIWGTETLLPTRPQAHPVPLLAISEPELLVVSYKTVTIGSNTVPTLVDTYWPRPCGWWVLSSWKVLTSPPSSWWSCWSRGWCTASETRQSSRTGRPISTVNTGVQYLQYDF